MDLNKLMSMFQSSQNQPTPPAKQNIAYYPQDFSSTPPQVQQQNSQPQQNISNLLPLFAMFFGKEKVNFGQILSKMPQFKEVQPFLSLFNKKEEKQSESSTPTISSYKKIED